MLNFDNIVKINLHVNITAKDVSSFENGLIIGKSAAISTDDRIKKVERLSDMLTIGFTADTAEYKAAELYFAQKPAPGGLYVARRDNDEPLADVIDACLEVTGDFWGIYVCTASAEESTALDAHLTKLNRCMQILPVVGTEEALTVATAMTGKKSRRTMVLQASNVLDGAAVLGRLCGLVRSTKKSSFSLCYKALSGVTPAEVTEVDVENLHKQNGAVYVTRGYSRQLLDGASTGSGLRVDEVLYLDMISADIQDALVNVLMGDDGRLPQNDATTTRFENAISTVLEGYYNRAVLDIGIWRGEPIGNIETGDVLPHGYAMYADPYFAQSQYDREQKKAMPITVLITLSGAVESVEINVYAQR